MARAIATRCCCPPESWRGVVVGTVGKAYLGKHLHADLIRLLLGQFTRHDEPFGHILQGGLVAEQVVVLEHKGRLFAQPGNVGAAGMGKVEAFAVKHQLPGIGSLQKIQAAQQGGLAGAGRPKNGHYIALFHGQVYPAQHGQLTGDLPRTGAVEKAGFCIGAEGFLHIADL